MTYIFILYVYIYICIHAYIYITYTYAKHIACIYMAYMVYIYITACPEPPSIASGGPTHYGLQQRISAVRTAALDAPWVGTEATETGLDIFSGWFTSPIAMVYGT